MGELLRRYWMPVAATCQLATASARPVRLLGEDLVLFRDTQGRVGLIDESCPHRRTSLRYGCVDHEGIRCPYHGWKFDASGSCLEMPAEPDGSPLLNRVRAKTYPVEELGGLVFAYLGPPPAPLLPRYDLFVWEGVLRDAGYALLPCNWLQIMENSVDPFHVEWLHGHHLAHVRQQTGLPEPQHYPRRQVKIGFDVFEYGIIKRRVVEGGTEEDDDWKIGHPLIFPVMLRVGSSWQHRFQIRVPVDDTHTMHYWYACYRPAEGVAVPSQDEIPVYEVPWRDGNGEYLVDFVDGQDIMAWVTQGPIADRTRETLGSSDRGIALYRRLLLEQVEEVRSGHDPLGVIRDAEKNRVIELPQEREKFGQGKSFLAESIQMGHVRYSPIKDLILTILKQG
jgi:5,5'-dehydrodivanillate O-demethylase